MSTRGKVLIILLFVVMFVVGMFYYISNSLKFQAVQVTSNSVLEIPLTGQFTDRARPDASVFGGYKGLSLYALKASLNKAAIDSRIRGVVIYPNMMSGMGYGKLKEIAHTMLRFRKNSGKKIYAFIETCGPKEYYLSTFCDSVYAVPTGLILFGGMQGSVYYVKEGLDKLGIRADFVAIGKYKNAPEMFTRKSFSDDQKEVMNRLLDQYYETMMTDISSNRHIPVEKVKSFFDQGIFSSEKALEAGLIDKVTYRHDLMEQLSPKGSDTKPVNIKYYQREAMESGGLSSSRIAVLYAQGQISLGSGDLENQILSGSMTDLIYKLKKDKKIQAVVLRIDSPGGSGTASEEIYKALLDLKASKPLIVSVADMAASGGYYLAMAGDSIIADPGSIVGSIGVFAGKFAMGGLYEKLGINKESISRGKNATLFDEKAPFSPAERRVLTTHLEEFYQQFVAKVAQSRNRSWDEIHTVAQGRVWSAEDGLTHGLVDKIGTLDDAVKAARKAAGFLSDDVVSVVAYPHYRPIFEKLLEKFNVEERASVSLVRELADSDPVSAYFSQFAQYRTGEPLALFPFYLEWK